MIPCPHQIIDATKHRNSGTESSEYVGAGCHTIRNAKVESRALLSDEGRLAHICYSILIHVESRRVWDTAATARYWKVVFRNVGVSTPAAKGVTVMHCNDEFNI